MDSKRFGTICEVAFKLHALKRNLEVFPSEGDFSVVDCIVMSPAGKCYRVQIKGTSTITSDGIDRPKPKNKYRVVCGRGTAKESLKATEVDVLACYIEPRDVWYLIPMTKAHGKKSFAFFVKEDSKSQWSPFRDNWDIFLK